MEFNKIAGAVLLTALAAMVVSKVGDILVPEEHYVVQKEVDQPQSTTPAPEEKDPPVAQALAKADPKKGEALVKARCASCHTWNKGGANRVGPNLWGIVGRDKGSHEGFSYSSAMANAPGKWTFEQLYTYLENPQDLVKGTKMAFRLRKWDQRADVIAYLRTQNDNPPPLPKPEPATTTDPKETAPKDAAPEKAPAPDDKAAPEKKTEAPGEPDKRESTTPDTGKTDADKPAEPGPAETRPAEPESNE